MKIDISHLVLAQQGSELGPLAGFLPFLALMLIFYFLLIRPARKQRKQLEALIAGLKNGDRVITTGGIYGTVAGIRDHSILLKVSDQVKIEVAKSAVASLQAEPLDSSAK